MIANPIIPIPFMAVICLVLLILKRKGFFSYIRQILIVFLLFAINLRLMVPNPDAPTVERNVDVLFVVDNTISVLAEDYGEEKGRRIDAIKADCKYISEQLPGVSFSVISFGNSVAHLIPYTMDLANVEQAFKTINGQSSYYAKGTSFDEVLTYLGETLDREGDHYQVVFFISDGEISNDGELGSFPELADYIDAGAVLGYGTEKGGFMKAPAFVGDDSDEYLYYYDKLYNRRKARSVIDEENLKSIASDLGVEYIHMTQQDQIEEVLAELQAQIEKETADPTKDSLDAYSDTFFYLLIPLAAILVVDFIYYKRKVNI